MPSWVHPLSTEGAADARGRDPSRLVTVAVVTTSSRGFAARFVELAYATTVHGPQGETVDSAHVAIGDTTVALHASAGAGTGHRRDTASILP